MLKALRNKKGVTLVELLAVVVILGIIAAIAVPTIGGLISRQQEKADIATLQNIESVAKTHHLGEGSPAVGIYAITAIGIELGDNKIGTTSGGVDVTHVMVTVANNVTTVTFHSTDGATAANALDNLYVNDTYLDVTGEYTVATP